MKVIILNGAPNSGKDVIADSICKSYNYTKMMFKEQLFNFAIKVSGVSQEYWDRCYERDLKEVPNEKYIVDGKPVSPRNYLIHISENVVKPIIGKSFFGDSLASQILNSKAELVVVSDGGFKEELIPLLSLPHDVYLVRLHREGTSFEGDSRKFIYPDLKLLDNQKDFYNNSTIEEIAEKIVEWVN